MVKIDPLKPNAGLLCKLASLIVHANEFMSPGGHHVDKTALDGLRADADVQAWLKAMTMMGMAPVKRS